MPIRIANERGLACTPHRPRRRRVHDGGWRQARNGRVVIAEQFQMGARTGRMHWQDEDFRVVQAVEQTACTVPLHGQVRGTQRRRGSGHLLGLGRQRACHARKHGPGKDMSRTGAARTLHRAPPTQASPCPPSRRALPCPVYGCLLRSGLILQRSAGFRVR